jgi:outer membrane protein assembly factor BamB
MSSISRPKLFVVLALVCFLPAVSHAQDVLRFRGTSADSFYTDPAFNPNALKSGAKIIWQAEVKQGMSGVSLKGNRLYTMGNDRTNDTVYCLDATTGKVLWTHSYPCGSNEHPGPRATPTIDGDTVYTMSLEGHIFALDAANGKVLWKKHAVTDFGAQKPSWALASSVVVDGALLYININQHGVCLNKKTGAKVWASPPAEAGYATPVLFTAGGKKMGAFFGADAIYGVDLATGKVAWKEDWYTSYQVNAADPLIFGDKLFISSGYGKGCALYRFTASSIKEVWHNSNLAAHFSSPVFIKGHIYGITDNSGSGGRFRVLNAATGAVTLNQEVQFGNFAVVNDKYFLIAFERGEIAVAEVTNTAYAQKSSVKLRSSIYWTAPVVSGGRAFIRNQRGDLYCLDMK